MVTKNFNFHRKMTSVFQINRLLLMHSLKYNAGGAHQFSTSLSKEPSMVSWISPQNYIRASLPKPDPPPEALPEIPRRSRGIKYSSVIELIKREKDPNRIFKIFKMMGNQRGFVHKQETYAATLIRLAHLKEFQLVDCVLHQMKYDPCKIHESLFVELMKCFSKSRHHNRVVEMFNAIEPITRVKPSLKATSTCLNLLVNSKQVDLTRSFLLQTKKTFNLRPNTCIFNILVKHHCKNRDLESAIEVVKEMKLSDASYPNLITYSTLMDGLCANGKLEEAINVFEEMVSEAKIVPDALTYNILINGFCHDGKVDRAAKIIDFMKKNGCKPNVSNYTSLMTGFSKEGNVQEVRRLFNEMKDVGLRIDLFGYTTFLNCLCKAGEIDEAIGLLEEMGKKDHVTYNTILLGLCNYDRTYEALEFLQRLAYEGVNLQSRTYRIVLNSLCKLGDLQKATGLVGVMASRGFQPHFATSNDLLLGLCEGGSVVDAALVLELLVPLLFNPKPQVWSRLVEVTCRERRLLATFELIDVLTKDVRK